VDNIILQYQNGSPIGFVKAKDIDLYKPYPQASTDEGQPTVYYLWNQNVNFYPWPDKTYTFQIRYYAGDADLVNQTDIPNLPIQGPELLALWGYKMILQSNFMFDQAAAVANEYNSKLQDLLDAEVNDNDDTGDMVDMLEPSYDKQI